MDDCCVAKADDIERIKTEHRKVLQVVPGINVALFAVEAMREIGVDISAKKPRGVDDVVKTGQKFDYVITVCDEASAEQCPLFPGAALRHHWSLPDPSEFKGTREERLEQTRGVRNLIESKIREFCPATCAALA